MNISRMIKDFFTVEEYPFKTKVGIKYKLLDNGTPIIDPDSIKKFKYNKNFIIEIKKIKNIR